jgi:hypothetical protein
MLLSLALTTFTVSPNMLPRLVSPTPSKLFGKLYDHADC